MLNPTLEIDRADLGTARLVEEPLAGPAPGEVWFRVERFAVTANTVTYAVTGDTLGYWDLFPDDFRLGPGTGHGLGRSGCIRASSGADRRPYYGWFPMSRYLDMTVSPTSDGLRDDGPHRSAHALVYRAYVATNRDPFHEPGADAEDRHALLRGLFITGFLAEDFFADHDYFGASRVLVLSASSKTAIGFAHCADSRPGIDVVGVTSQANHAFVHGLGCYDEAITCDDITAVPTGAPVVSIDMSGNGVVLERVHSHFGDGLRHSMAIGRSHHDAPMRGRAARSAAGVLLRTDAGQETRAGLGGPPGTRNGSARHCGSSWPTVANGSR